VILRPDTVYRVHVVVLPGSPDLVFKALITKGSGQHVASASSDSVDAGTSTHLLLKVHFLYLNIHRILWKFYGIEIQRSQIHANVLQVPASISDGDYRLKLEGYDVQHPQKAVLIKESPLVFNSDFLSIIVQLNRKIFANAMNGIIKLKHNSKLNFGGG
jgi:uncharacterized protein with PQ loop repeat